MGSTPLYDALRAFAAQRPLRMHMPGHKGKSLPAPELAAIAAIDFTELPPTGDLFSGGGAIGAAEALWAKVFHMASCLFLTGGSTQGVHAALALACKPGETVLLDRGSHRSAYNALALLDLKPVYLERPWLASEGITGPISPSSVAQALEEHPEAKTLCITSPTYYGVLSDLPALAELMHRRGGVLVVDGAHGAHLPFLGNDHLSAADLVVQPYRHATQSGVTQIAYWFDVPTLVTDVGGLGEIVPDGETGLVVRPDAEAIAEAIGRFFSDGLLERFRTNIREYKKRFTWERMVENLGTLYERIEAGKNEANR